VIANRAFEEAKQEKTSRPQRSNPRLQSQPHPQPQRSKPRLQSQPNRRKQNRNRNPQPKPKAKTAAELLEENLLERLRKNCVDISGDKIWRIEQSGLVAVNVLKSETRAERADDVLAKQLDELASRQRGFELCLLQNEVHHSLSDILLVLHDGTNPSSEVLDSVKQHQHLLFPAICILCDKGRNNKAQFEQLSSSGDHVMVIDHPDTELAPKFLVKETGSSILAPRYDLALIFSCWMCAGEDIARVGENTFESVETKTTREADSHSKTPLQHGVGYCSS
jgi:hypothetical protein